MAWLDFTWFNLIRLGMTWRYTSLAWLELAWLDLTRLDWLNLTWLSLTWLSLMTWFVLAWFGMSVMSTFKKWVHFFPLSELSHFKLKTYLRTFRTNLSMNCCFVSLKFDLPYSLLNMWKCKDLNLHLNKTNLFLILLFGNWEIWVSMNNF